MKCAGFGLGAVLSLLVGIAQASPSVLELPCYDENGAAVPRTEILAIRVADLEAGGKPERARARGGRCRIALESGLYWVKAQSPGLRSVPVRIRWPARALDRSLTLVPTRGRDAARQQALHAMTQRDQEVRNALAEAEREHDETQVARLLRDMQAIDADNKTTLQAWLAAGGFPRR